MEGRGGDQVTIRELGPVTMTRTLLGGPGTGGEGYINSGPLDLPFIRRNVPKEMEFIPMGCIDLGLMDKEKHT